LAAVSGNARARERIKAVDAGGTVAARIRGAVVDEQVTLRPGVTKGAVAGFARRRWASTIRLAWIHEAASESIEVECILVAVGKRLTRGACEARQTGAGVRANLTSAVSAVLAGVDRAVVDDRVAGLPGVTKRTSARISSRW